MRPLLIIMALIALTGAFGASAEMPLSDRQMTHQIHCRIVEDTSLPFSAHVVRVHVKNGIVTLQGRVYTEEEKVKVGEKAAIIAGDENVINNITLKRQS